MVPDDVVARRLIGSVPFFTPDVQADRRAFVRHKAYVAARLLEEATRSHDADDLAGFVGEADRVLTEAMAEILKASLR